MTEQENRLAIARAALIEQKRQKAINSRIGQAYLALAPCLEELSTGAKMWQDSAAFFIEKKEAGKIDNEFLVEGDNNATYQKALRFLLQKSHNDLDGIAETLLEDRRGSDGYDQARQIVRNRLSEILNPPKRK